jgi:hypothetical protein
MLYCLWALLLHLHITPFLHFHATSHAALANHTCLETVHRYEQQVQHAVQPTLQHSTQYFACRLQFLAQRAPQGICRLKDAGDIRGIVFGIVFGPLVCCVLPLTGLPGTY